MISVIGWVLLFFALIVLCCWTVFTPFPMHGLVAFVWALAAIGAGVRVLLALAHLTSNSGGL